MEDWKEFTAKTVEDAVELVLAEFQTTRDKVEVEVIEKESSGFLGLFNNKPAKIKARMIVAEGTNVEAKPVAGDVTPAAENVKSVSPVNNADPAGAAKKFLKEVLTAMDITAEIEAEINEESETLEVQIIGDDMGILIGKRGQTLDSLQYLTSLVVNKEVQSYLKVKLDTENYRARRKETLENLAKNIAIKVKKTHRAVTLEPMNPYERRIIHSSLQNDKFVETHSEGEEPFRKVVITPKKGVNYNEGGHRQNNRYSSKRYDSRGGYNKKNISSREFHKKYGADTKDYSTDYKKDYADYLESKAAAKAALEQSNADQTEA